MKQNPEICGLPRAKREVQDAARWARQQGFLNIAPRLEWAARMIQEEINKTNSAAAKLNNGIGQGASAL
jgi:hypothetical protein